MTFFIQCYEEIDGQLKFNGLRFEGNDLGNEIPCAGDCIISPLHKADFAARDPDKHFAYDVLKRYFVPDITPSVANEVKLLVRKRSLSDIERGFFKAQNNLERVA
jgi:hypothetical protein